jgi:hypothetical protein
MCDLVKLMDFLRGQSCFRQFTTLRYQANGMYSRISVSSRNGKSTQLNIRGCKKKKKLNHREHQSKTSTNLAE